MTRKPIEGWPLTDPYPFRGQEAWPPVDTEKVDCEFVRQHKVSVEKEEGDEYEYYLDLAWAQINVLQEELQQGKNRIKWLENVGGERLQMACGADIMCRMMVADKTKTNNSRKENPRGTRQVRIV